ncbi:MAG: helix-turn-helix domain-containing protein [Steroidobacteraceae bacterium]
MLLASRPAPALRHLIRHYYQVKDSLVRGVSLQPVPARSPQIIEFMFGTHYQVRKRGCEAPENVRAVALVGARTSPSAELILSGNVDAFTIVFLPGAFSMLFGVPAVELTNGDFNGQEVLGQRINELHCRLGEATTFHDRVRVADKVLTAARPATESVSAIVHTARAMIRNEGSVRVSDIVHQTGLGLRQFERRFAHEIGVSPKLYARIIRFEAALQRRAITPSMSWTDIAHDLGYHDQMHMVHDFTRLSGDSPEAISSQLDMFVQPEVLTGRPATKLARMS